MEELNFTEFKEKNLVTKSISLIEGHYKLTSTEQKILLTLISKIEPGDIDFKQYRFKIKDFEKFLGIKRNNLYKQMFQITENIMKGVVKVIGDSKKVYFTHWVQSAEYELGTGYAEFTFDPKLKPLLLQLKNKFVSYQLLNIIKLKSFYSIRIYELLKQYEKIGQRTLELKELREMLGIKPNEYKLYSDFKKRVLQIAEREINEKTELNFTFNEIKKGRKVVFIKFIIYQTNKDESLPVTTATKNELSERLQKYFCLSPLQTNEVLNMYNEKYIIENLAHIEKKFKKGQIKNIGAYTLKALKEDHRNQKSQFDIEKEEIEKQKEKERRQKEIKEKQKDEYYQYQKQEIEKYKKTLSPEEIQKIEGKIEKEINQTIEEGKNPEFTFPMLFRIETEKYFIEKSKALSFKEWLKIK